MDRFNLQIADREFVALVGPSGGGKSTTLASRSGEELVLGIGPEPLSDQAHARFPTTDNHLTMRATLVQPPGDRMDVYLATARHPRSVAQLQAHLGMRPGDELPVYFDPARMHFFETGESGRRVAANPSDPRASSSAA